MKINKRIKNILINGINTSTIINLDNVDLISIKGNNLIFYFSWGSHEHSHDREEKAYEALKLIREIMNE